MNVTMRLITKKNDLGRIESSWKLSISQAQSDAANNIVDHMRASFRLSKTGHLYWKPDGSGGSVLHQASAPGEPPAIWFGHLDESFKVKKLNQYAVGITSTDWKAVMLDQGGGNIAARPYVQPAINKEAAKYKQALMRILRTVK